jgi:branched-chain amino acid transport system ATP-binding protein
MTPPLLEVSGLDTSYGSSQVLFGMEFSVHAGEAVTLIGRNGMGKTTTVRSLFGIARADAGSIRFEGSELRGLLPHEVARRGLALVPEGRRVFPNLTVEENLTVAAATRGGRRDWTLARVLALFPSLAARRHNMGNELSGGEQQMVAIGRALMTNPKLLVLDEATEGLAPLIRQDIWRVLDELRRLGQSCLLIDKDIETLTRIAGRHYIVEKGRVVWSGTSAELGADSGVRARYLTL